MDELEHLLQRSFFLVVGSVSLGAKEIAQGWQSWQDFAQGWVEQGIREGESIWLEWTQSGPSTTAAARRQRLHDLVRGDWALAERLLYQARQSYPGQSEEWYYDKVIYDLHRDYQL